MKILNRGFIIVRPTQLFWDWAAKFENELEFSVDDDLEPNVYLITEDFFEIEPVIEKNYKKILETELRMITDEEEDWPLDMNFELFLNWFILEVGSTVFDLEKSDLKSEDV